MEILKESNSNQNFDGGSFDVKNFINYMCCPMCKGDLDLIRKEDKQGHDIFCFHCSTKFPVQGNVVIFDSHHLVREAKSFSTQWKKFSKTQIDVDELNESELRFQAETELNDLHGEIICEFGVGAGRFMKIAMEQKPKLAFGVDASESVFVASKNLKDHPNLVLLKCDILNLPIKPQTFTRSYCIGVLHHTTDPKSGFLSMSEVMAPGGVFALSVYENNLFERPNKNTVRVAMLEVLWSINLLRVEAFRAVCSRLSSNTMLAYCLSLVPVLHVLNKVPVVRYLRYLLPSTCYRGLPVEWSMCDTMDTYATKVVHQYRAKTIFQWFKAVKYSSVDLLNSRAGWVAVRGVKGEEYNKSLVEFEKCVEPPRFHRR